MEFAVERVSPALARVRGASRAAMAGAVDGELLVAIAGGDRAAFTELYERYSRAVLGLAIDRLGDRGRAEEATQDAFVSVWRAASSYRPEIGPGAPWLYAVARNAIASSWRKRIDIPVERFEEASAEAGPAERAEQSWRSFRVHRAIHSLPAHQRELIELSYWGELSQSEIAARLDIPLGTVKTRTRAALSRLSVALDQDMR